MNEGVPPPSQRTSAPMVVAGAGGAIAWTCLEPGPLGLDFGLTELDEGMIGLEVKGVAAASNASSVPGLRVGMVLQQIDEFHIRAKDAPNSARHAFTFARATPPPTPHVSVARDDCSSDASLPPTHGTLLRRCNHTSAAGYYGQRRHDRPPADHAVLPPVRRAARRHA